MSLGKELNEQVRRNASRDMISLVELGVEKQPGTRKCTRVLYTIKKGKIRTSSFLYYTAHAGCALVT